MISAWRTGASHSAEAAKLCKFQIAVTNAHASLSASFVAFN